MKVKISNIIEPWYAPRKEHDEEYIQELADSMKDSGQWDPIMLRRNEDGKYELIAGSQRIRAAEKNGWKEIEANVLDIDEQEAAMLAIETNIVRKELKEIEEGRAIKQMMDKYGFTQEQVGERLRRSHRWVGQRLSLALDITKEVQNAIGNGFISVSQAVIIGQLDKKKQSEFLQFVIQLQRKEDRKLSQSELRKELKKYLNDTIYTIGYEGWDLDGFLKELKDNKIDALVDIRDSGASQFKPEFSEKVLKQRIKDAGIMYLERREFGVPYEVREAYINGGLSHECFTQYYNWKVSEKIWGLASELKELGKSVLMCTERYPQPKGKQKHYCHRDLLANLIMQTDHFKKREDF